MGAILLYVGGAVIFLWGIGHLVPTKSVVQGFGEISDDNKRIITMEWIIEGLTLCFLGLLVLVVTYASGAGDLARYVYWMSAGMLIVLACVSAFTGARTAILPMKLCPWVKGSVAVLILVGSP